MQVDAGSRVIVGASADTEAQREAAAAQAVERGHLLRQQRRAPHRGEQHLGLQPDATGHAGENRQRDERFGVVPDEAVEQAERAERAGVSADRPLLQHVRVVDGQADTDLHGYSEQG